MKVFYLFLGTKRTLIIPICFIFRTRSKIYPLLIPCDCDTLEKIHCPEVAQFHWQIQGHRNLVQRGDTIQRPHLEVCVCHKVEDKRASTAVAISTQVCCWVIKPDSLVKPRENYAQIRIDISARLCKFSPLQQSPKSYHEGVPILPKMLPMRQFYTLFLI